MIPKIIHYCWFGGKPLPELAERCIESWKRYCPDYEIKRWDESNYDFNRCNYTKEAYECKKWAFVTDYARFDILYQYGGVYFDTDVELIQPIEDILASGAFMGQEVTNQHGKTRVLVASGLGIAAPAKLPIFEEIMAYYQDLHFLTREGIQNQTTVVEYTTEVLKNYGYKEEEKIQQIQGITIYPAEYFAPMDYSTGQIHLTEQTRSIHHYAGSWKTEQELKYIKLEQKMVMQYGISKGRRIANFCSFPFRVNRMFREKGLVGTLKYICRKIIKR